MEISLSVQEIASICGASRQQGHFTGPVTGIASLAQAKAGDLSFLASGKYRRQLETTEASVILVPETFEAEPPEGKTFLFVANPSRALMQIGRRLEAQLWPKPPPGIHPTAVVSPSASVDPTAVVGPFCVIEADACIGPGSWLEAQAFVGRAVRIGRDCRLGPGVRVLAECILGDRVYLHAGVVVGGDGFGYETDAGRHEKIPQIGNVVIRDDVEVGPNSTIDRARMGSTMIGEGTKIDNLVQVGHNCIIGRHCILCAQVGLAGSTTLEDYVVMGGQSGTGGHLTIGKGAMVGGQSGVHTDLEAGAKVRASPMMPLLAANRYYVLREKLPALFRRVDALEAAVGLSGKASSGRQK